MAGLAARQHGVVATRQLRRLGFSHNGVYVRVKSGRLHRVHRDVYAVGHAVVSREGRWMAAVLACGPGAVLSHRSAAEALGLRASARAQIDVSVPNRAGRTRAGIDAHARRPVAPADRTTVSGIPCTTVARTLLDLAEVVDRRSLERACDQAEVLRVFDLRAIQGALDRAGNHPGARPLRAVLAEHYAGQTLTRSELEERFLALCEGAGIPRPEVNAWLDLDGWAVQVDFLWRTQRVVVETDGHRSHTTRQRFEADRRRDQRLTLAGWRVVRFTWRQVTRDQAEVERTVLRLVGAAR